MIVPNERPPRPTAHGPRPQRRAPDPLAVKQNSFMIYKSGRKVRMAVDFVKLETEP